MLKTLIRHRLERSVSRYFKKHPEVKLVAVVGSVGKTSTKMAIGTVLSERYRVRLHEGNHNSEISAPLAILGVDFPQSLRSMKAWSMVFKAIRRRLREPADVDIIVQELGTDRIGQIPHFGKYLKPDLAVVTAVSDEHMEYFKTLDAVAAEELSAVNYSKQALINRDDIHGKYAELIKNENISTYGTSSAAEYSIETSDFSLDAGVTATLKTRVWDDHEVKLHVLGEQSVRSAAGAAAVGAIMGLTADEVKRGLANIRPVKGRMSTLRGLDDSIIIDDTYNSSPLAAAAALRALYSLQVPQRIAVLGSMNELGTLAEEAHRRLGELCDASQLAHVVTVGEQAEKWLAPAARLNGCHVVSFRTAIEAGAYTHRVMESGAAILFKGSEGKVYLEEAVKIVLHATEEEDRLVRQSPAWMKRKTAYFESILGADVPSEDVA